MNNLNWIAGSILSLPIFAFLGCLLFGALKTADRSRLFSDSSKGTSRRRRVESNPNVICGFPIQQQARKDAPFF